MRNALLMFVMLLGSFTYAQTFDFGCVDLEESRKQLLENLSRDGVFVHVTNGSGEYKIEFTDSEDNPYGYIEDWEPVTISGLVNLEDISESNFTTYTLVQTENIIIDILDGKYIIEPITYDAFTVSEIDLATSAGKHFRCTC